MSERASAPYRATTCQHQGEIMDKEALSTSLVSACKWLVDVAQVKGEVPRAGVRTHHVHTYWKGAIKGEYSVKDGQWSFFARSGTRDRRSRPWSWPMISCMRTGY